MPIPGAMAGQGTRAAMAERGAWVAMVDPGTQEAMAERGAWVAMVDPGTQEAMAERGAWVAMVDPGTQEAMAERGAWVAMMDRGAWVASMAGSPPPQSFLPAARSWTGPARMTESWTGPEEKQEGAVLEQAQEGTCEEWALGLGSTSSPHMPPISPEAHEPL